jgi:hypothetical protein
MPRRRYLLGASRPVWLAALFLTFGFTLSVTLVQAAEVTLAWDPIRDPDAVLYRIYHRAAADPYVFSEPDWEGAATRCTLSNLTDGTRHYFVGRSVDALGNESVNSMEVSFLALATDSDPPSPTPDLPASDDLNPDLLFDADLADLLENRWTIVDDDPPGASVVVFHDAIHQSRVAHLVGDWINNSFQLGRVDGAPLAADGPWRLVWEMKADLYYFVSVVLETSAGERTLYYTPSDFDLLGSGPYIHHGLGMDSLDGRWYTHDRHLDEDLQHAQPDARLEGILAIHIRGQVQIDDIWLEPVP